jgi:hypothetical protein
MPFRDGLPRSGNIPNRGLAERQGPVLRWRRGPLPRQLAGADAVEDPPRGRHIPGSSLRGEDAVLSLQGWALHVPTRTWATLPRPDRAPDEDEGEAAARVGERVFV